MRFPLTTMLKIAGSMAANRLLGRERFATVLQLEPLHTCNLTCTGCGRIREYSTSLKNVMPVEDCLGAARECGAPMVSVCGGEPLIYPEIEALVEGLLGQGRVVYLCTNGVFMRKKMRAALAAAWRAGGHPWGSIRELGALVDGLERDGLVTAAQAEEIREGAGRPGAAAIVPNGRFYWNVHLDGLEASHDAIVERAGVFAECIAAIRMAKRLGFLVATNTTVYRESDPDEIEALFDLLGELGVDGHTISPGYEYSAAKSDMVKRLGLDPARFFLTRAGTREKFARAVEWGWRYPIFGTPGYLEFLAGERELPCSAWAIPTRNVMGWKGPCYLMTDAHHGSYRELLENTDWGRYGVGEGGVARDARCESCMVHCGFEPSAALGLAPRAGDLWKTLKFQMRPKRRAGAVAVGGRGAARAAEAEEAA